MSHNKSATTAHTWAANSRNWSGTKSLSVLLGRLAKTSWVCMLSMLPSGVNYILWKDLTWSPHCTEIKVSPSLGSTHGSHKSWHFSAVNFSWQSWSWASEGNGTWEEQGGVACQWKDKELVWWGRKDADKADTAEQVNKVAFGRHIHSSWKLRFKVDLLI